MAVRGKSVGQGKGPWDMFPGEGGNTRKTKMHSLHSSGLIFAKLCGTVLQVSNLTSGDGDFSLLQKETVFDCFPENVFLEMVVVPYQGARPGGPLADVCTSCAAFACLMSLRLQLDCHLQ